MAQRPPSRPPVTCPPPLAALPSGAAANRGPDGEPGRLPLDSGPARRRAFPAGRPARWCRPRWHPPAGHRTAGTSRTPHPAPPLSGAAACRLALDRPRGFPAPAWSRGWLVPGLPSPRASAPDPPARSTRRVPPRCPQAVARRPRRPVGLRPAGRARTGGPSLPQPGGHRRLPMRFRRGCRPAVPSGVSPAPCRFPSYACKRSDPPRRQQLFLNFFQDLFPCPPRPAFPQVNQLDSVSGELRPA